MSLPKETFHKLKDEKKQRILSAALKEFSAHSFSEASLNQIVKEAQIPWGSFYQYFVDKEDLFSYLVEGISADIKAVRQKNLPNYDDCDALTQFVNRLIATVELCHSSPEYVQIIMLNAKETDPFVKIFFELGEERKQEILKLFERDQQQGLVQSDIDLTTVIEVVFLYSKELFYSIGSDGNAYLKKMEDLVQIIRNGIQNG